jgi:hypothetical protein
MLVHVQPLIAPMSLTVCERSTRRPLGLAHNAASFHDDLRLTLAELDRHVAMGLLAPVGQEEFEMEFRFEALEDWRDFVSRPHAGDLEVDPAELSRAEADVSRSALVIVASEAQLAVSFQRTA